MGSIPSTVVLTGRDLDRASLVRVARERAPVELDASARAAMVEHRRVLEAAVAAGAPVYGATTGVGVLKRIPLDGPAAATYAERLLGYHRAGQGEPAPPDLVRATMVRLANAFAAGHPGVRPYLVDRLLDALARDDLPSVRPLGSLGAGDLVPLADLAAGLFDGAGLAAGEGLALVGGNAFSTAAAALAATDTERLLATLTGSAALALEGYGANGGALHPAVADARPYPGLARALGDLRALLGGGAVLDGSAARALQDPLTFRAVPQLLGAGLDALDHLDRVLAVELNAAQGNPLVVAAEGRVVSVANFEILPLAAALDHLRIVLASVLTAAGERVVKLLGAPWSGLPTGLAPVAGTSDAGLSYLGIAVQSLVAEARTLAAPVSLELASTAHAEGIEDRATSAPLAARRLAEQVALGERIAAIELAVGAQAVDLRAPVRRGAGTQAVHEAVRRHVASRPADGPVPDVAPLVEAVRSGEVAALVRAGD